MMKLRYWVIIAVLVLMYQCVSNPRPGTAPTSKVGSEGAGAVPAGDFSETGIASWYGEEFHGKETSNGEVYDMFKLTAAHQTLPFHTLVEVTNLENNRKVLVRINDRGPFAKGRIIDLSYKAAQELGVDGKGTATVALRIVRYAASPMGDDTPVKVKYFLQVGAFQVYENAREQLEKLQSMRLDLHFSIWKEDGFFKIFSERMPEKKNLEEAQRTLNTVRISSFIREIF